jgi:hypothetical protein
MVHVPANSLDVVPLEAVSIATNNGDFPLNGWVDGQFTLPKEQVTERGFALQLFQQQTKKGKTSYTPIWTFDKSTLNGSTLSFSFKPPKMTIAKGSTYLLVLYGDDKSKSPASASPSPSPSASPGAAPSPMPS